MTKDGEDNVESDTDTDPTADNVCENVYTTAGTVAGVVVSQVEDSNNKAPMFRVTSPSYKMVQLEKFLLLRSPDFEAFSIAQNLSMLSDTVYALLSSWPSRTTSTRWFRSRWAFYSCSSR